MPHALITMITRCDDDIALIEFKRVSLGIYHRSLRHVKVPLPNASQQPPPHGVFLPIAHLSSGQQQHPDYLHVAHEHR